MLLYAVAKSRRVGGSVPHGGANGFEVKCLRHKCRRPAHQEDKIDNACDGRFRVLRPVFSSVKYSKIPNNDQHAIILGEAVPSHLCARRRLTH